MMRRMFRALWALALVLMLAALAQSCQNRPATQGAGADSVKTSEGYKPEPAPATVLANQAGEQAFLANCALCHGDGGQGDGPIAVQLAEKAGVQPPNLTDASRLRELGREDIRRIIQEGGAHTERSNMMPSWPRMNAAVVDSVIDYVLQLPNLHAAVPSATIEKFMKAPAGAPDEGRRWYVYYCSGCHGPNGKGDGVNAERLRKEHNIRPRDLTDTQYMSEKSDQDLFVLVSLGGGHAGKSAYMPAWTQSLSPEQIKDLVAYLRVVSKTKPS